MRPYLLILLLLALLACEKTAFDIDPAKVYSPAELVEEIQGKCKNNHLWNGKQVTVSGMIGQPSTGRFLLLDERTRTPLTIMVAIKDSAELAKATAFLQANELRKATITGTARPEDMPTQLKCRTTIFVWIDNQNAVKL